MPPRTKMEAKQLGVTRYYTGKPCKRGHVSERSISGGCLRCKAIRDSEYAAANPAKLREKSARYRHRNPEKSRQESARFREKERDLFPERIKQRLKRWAEKNPERFLERRRSKRRNRRARIRNAEGTHTASEVRTLNSMQKGRCAACTKKLKGNFHVDHIVPLCRGGGNSRLNIQLLCPACNLSKHDKDPIDWQRERGLLL